jgi:hypothetical protein
MNAARDLLLGRNDKAKGGRQGGAGQPSVHTQYPHRNVLLPGVARF